MKCQGRRAREHRNDPVVVTPSIEHRWPKFPSQSLLEPRPEIRVARPEGFERPTLCLEATLYKTLSAASGVAYEEARHLSRP